MVQANFTLKGKTVTITRPRGQAEETIELIKKYGGNPYSFPTIELTGTDDLSTIKGFIDELTNGKIGYVVFMSPNGIKYLLNSAERLGLKAKLKKQLEKTAMMAVGPKTAKTLEAHNIKVNLIPNQYSSEGILECFQQLGISGKVIYIPRTTSATPILANKLREMGGVVQEIYVYRSLLPHDKKLTAKFFQDLTERKIHAIIFSSSLGVKNFFQMLKEFAPRQKLLNLMNSNITAVAIGPITAETLRKMGLDVDVMPDEYVFEEAVTALMRYWKTK
jgi:uroporphyrinogen-III synthase